MSFEDAETIRRVLREASDACADYLVSARFSGCGVRKTAELRLSESDSSFPSAADTDAAGLTRLLGAYLEATPRTDHVGFANQLYGGVTLAGIVGEMAAAVSSTTMATHEAAPAATQVEIGLVRKVGQLAGMPGVGSDGIVTSGGSQSNLIALLCARYWKEPRTKEQGLFGLPRMVAFVSSQAHYSFAGAANQLGIGTADLRCIPAGADGRMLPEELEKAILKAKENGEVPFFVAATAGTTVLGAFDPIDLLSPIAKKHGLWLHVDGAWGGPLLLSKKHRHLLSGVSEADSFAMDIHKLMSVPLTCSVIVTRHARVLTEACSAGNRSYLFHADHVAPEFPDLGVKSIACGRRPDCIKAWMSWKYLGDEGYEREIDALVALARRMAGLLKQSATLELLNDPQFLNVCFRYAPRDGVQRDLNDLNLKIRAELVARGRWLVNYAWLGQSVCIRFVLTNFRLCDKDVEDLVAQVEAIGAELCATPKQSTPRDVCPAGRVSPSII